ncbi:ethanolamine utilization protein EutL [Paenibacillus darwinianus]|uniref:Ethanolamine utilization protein EutL n=3 Tax=Paenibacillus darwinianus TaxID=1380763 RepID=A0A9W5S0R4_9BACL|nr:ethanolamine utilization microcompartment protein EutL [Paenibacillus darwinianus]EXX88121.1 ethanolamine utilization protein EutL [Paenibacillus darwinianus]EXX89049.1 ethanolamine utilization protein EutL [Paenibacillus darwinianus]
MRQQPIRAVPLAVRVIPNVDAGLARQLELKPGIRSLGLLTSSIDDVGYTAIDEATKRSAVEVVYARSFYAGSGHASGPLSGEFIGIIGGATPAEVRSGLEAAVELMAHGACFYALNEEATHAYYAHVVSRTGSYLSRIADIPEGEPLAYLIAPPLEAICGVDAALKAADVRLCQFYGPPTETNFAGGLLTGSQSACAAAAEAFAAAVGAVAKDPKRFG